MKQKAFLITIDTEGDNLWKWQYGDIINTNNALYIPRFQQLCNHYGFKPVYLTNYEMVCDQRFVRFAKKELSGGNIEIGMHLHADNTPPKYQLAVEYPENYPYLIEFPKDIMEQKIEVMTRILEDVFECKMVSHRAGRWALNDTYIEMLVKNGYQIECSVTPGIDWSKTKGITIGSHGADYSKAPLTPYFIDAQQKLLEIPVSIRHVSKSFLPMKGLTNSLRHLKQKFIGQKLWIRPNGKNLQEILYLLEYFRDSDDDYVMFMLHSSELMPGGSPTFPSTESIEILYQHMTCIFKEASTFCEGKTLQEYAVEKLNVI